MRLIRNLPAGDQHWAAVAAMDAQPLRRRHTHRQGLATAVRTTRWLIPNLVHPLKAISILRAVGIPSVLVGVYSLAGWLKQPRATQDVDLLVSARLHSRAVRTIRGAFPRLAANRIPQGTRLTDKVRGESLITLLHPNQPPIGMIDIIKPDCPLTKSIGRNCFTVPRSQPYRIPTIEMALALKFSQMNCQALQYFDRLQHSVDFIAIIEFNQEIDPAKLERLGELNGRGKALVEAVRQFRDGEQLRLI